MKRLMPRLPSGGWTRVIGWTLTVTVFVSVVSMAGAWYGAVWLNGRATSGDVIVALALAIVLTLPICSALMIKIEQLRVANDKLHFYATTDGLTGALSRGAFTADVERMLRADTSPRNDIGSLLVLDVDKFKNINDAYGHQQGDVALRLVAAAIRANVRGFDRVGRLGGEEFGVFLVEAQPEYALQVAERIRESISDIEFTPDLAPAPITISIGLANAMPGMSFQKLYHDADMSLYQAKAKGRNRVEKAAWGDAPLRHPVPAPVSSVG